MGTFPWGPNGPETGPNEVTPNPTPPYVPPPPAPSYEPPASYYAPPASGPVAYSGGSAQYTGPVQPRRKHYSLALILTFFFGPLGLFYVTTKGALAMLFLLVAVPVTLGIAGVLPGGSTGHPFAILDHDAVMNGMWSLCAVLSMLWSVVAVNRHNAALEAS